MSILLLFSFTHRLFLAACVALPLWIASPGVRAEALRCSGTSMGPGSSRLEVMKKCGEPALKDSYCAPVTTSAAGNAHSAPGAVTINVLPCLPVDEWLYERGPGDLPAVVRMHNGVITSIHYGRDFPPRQRP